VVVASAQISLNLQKAAEEARIRSEPREDRLHATLTDVVGILGSLSEKLGRNDGAGAEVAKKRRVSFESDNDKEQGMNGGEEAGCESSTSKVRRSVEAELIVSLFTEGGRECLLRVELDFREIAPVSLP